VAGVAFVLCAVTSAGCLGLLTAAYRRSGGRLVFWSAVCFAGLALNNALLAVNALLLPKTHMPWRAVPAAIGLTALAYGLIAEELRARPATAHAKSARSQAGART
jgi:Family of unknown function (DUF5985)